MVKRIIMTGLVAVVLSALTAWCVYALKYNYPKLGKETYCNPTTKIRLVNVTRQLFGKTTGEIFISNNQNNQAFLSGACH